ncbi:MAG: glycoside hydrolase family 43 protein [Abitibacteriaceae bacterium]|nr:glycoside hydrolase family 43 protein [Abditibacteriaceae bacterium]
MQLTYENPVWPGYLADPFVLKWHGEYYAYGTGSSVGDKLEADGKMFPVVYSKDLAHWEYIGGALEPLSPDGLPYWAPEVAERGGTFYMYYSAAGAVGDETHRLRVATADHPAGPFRDSGRVLLPEEDFTIDAHPFRDPKDGQWYLFFAKDFFDERVGTGTAVVPLQDDMMTPAAAPRPVLRASADWHIYERDRRMYDQVWEAWHTVEGPFIVCHDGLYYCLYSGGAWHTPNYGVSYGIAEHVLGPYRDEWSAQGPTVLTGIEGKVLGPGHNSVVIGLDNQTEWMVYHAWDVAKTARRMCIDPLLWTPQGPRCAGPTTGSQTLDI